MHRAFAAFISRQFILKRRQAAGRRIQPDVMLVCAKPNQAAILIETGHLIADSFLSIRHSGANHGANVAENLLDIRWKQGNVFVDGCRGSFLVLHSEAPIFVNNAVVVAPSYPLCRLFSMAVQCATMSKQKQSPMNLSAPGSSAPGIAAGGVPPQWLALKEAGDFLGVHFTTLRAWADKGDIPVFRTPGGHRRFSLDDLRRFLAQRSNLYAPDVHGLVHLAVDRTRQELGRSPTMAQEWRYPLQGEAEQARRQRGRQLFSLAVAFVLKPAQSERLLEQGRELGKEYGREAAASGVGLADTGKAVQFFRSQLVLAVRDHEGADTPDADDLRVQRLIDQFLDEVLYAVLDGYERTLR